jgi:hypothetical protein
MASIDPISYPGERFSRNTDPLKHVRLMSASDYDVICVTPEPIHGKTVAFQGERVVLGIDYCRPDAQSANSAGNQPVIWRTVNVDHVIPTLLQQVA